MVVLNVTAQLSVVMFGVMIIIAAVMAAVISYRRRGQYRGDW